MLTGVDKRSGERLSDDNIIAQCITFLVAGHETTSGLLSFAIHYLLKDPAVVARAEEEVDRVLGTDTDVLPTYQQVQGLEPALEWHVRDVGRRSGVPIDLSMHGDFELLSEQHRTCVYRSVQEALTNCVRHARASRIAVDVNRHADGFTVTVADNGVGFDVAQRGNGLGLRGIEERVRELHGVLTIKSAPGAGTTLTMKVPLSARPLEVAHARAAG